MDVHICCVMCNAHRPGQNTLYLARSMYAPAMHVHMYTDRTMALYIYIRLYIIVCGVTHVFLKLNTVLKVCNSSVYIAQYP